MAMSPAVCRLLMPLLASLFLGMLVSSANSATGSEGGSLNEPYRLVRTLLAIQDRTAHGSQEALKMQSPLLSQIERKLLEAPDLVWQEPHNARAALSYSLSGGSPEILRKLSRLSPAPAISPTLLAGVLAYLEGREEVAIRNLEGIDPHSLPPGLNGRISLVKSALYAKRDSQKAMEFLDLSRLFLPGTLVDEGALRREIFLAGQLGLNDKFKMLAKHYLQRFPHSIYANDFHQRFSAALVRLDMAGTEQEIEWLSGLLKALDIPAQINVNLILAKQALSQGKTQMAVFGSERALALAPINSTAHERAKLYHAAASIVQESRFSEGRLVLMKINRALLPPDDINLLESATYLATQIRDLPSLSPSAVPENITTKTDQDNTTQKNPVDFEIEPKLDTSLKKIRELINDSDKLIGGGAGL